MTPHINANPGDFAETVIMPGDPLRAQYIAETYLTDAKRVCDTRNMFGFTGYYRGKPISLMAHGMGIPSVSIYAHELINEFGVKKLIRIGTCGAVDSTVDMNNVIVATGAGTSSSANRDRFGGYDFAAVPDFDLLRRCWTVSQHRQLPAQFGNTFTNDLLVLLKSYPDRKILIVGHSDNTGSDAFNLALSEQRAINVRNWLLKYTPHTFNDFIIRGKGALEPIASNATKEGQTQNRRVDVLLIPSNEPEMETDIK